MLDWLENKKIILTGERDKYNMLKFIDNRTTERLIELDENKRVIPGGKKNNINNGEFTGYENIEGRRVKMITSSKD